MNLGPAKNAKNPGVRVPTLIPLPPKRRFKKNAGPEEKASPLPYDEIAAEPALGSRRERLKKSGRIVLRWPAAAPDLVAPVPNAIR